MANTDMTLRMWTIYRHPRDYPKHYVVRRWDVTDGGQTPGEAQTADTLEGARDLIPPGLHCLVRDERDHPSVVETWI